MRMKTTLGLLIVAALFTGCIAPKIPQTELKFNPNTKSLIINSPKDVTIGGATVIQNTNGFSMTVTNYSATNNAAMVIAIGQAQAEVAKNALQTINNLAELGKALAAKAP